MDGARVRCIAGVRRMTGVRYIRCAGMLYGTCHACVLHGAAVGKLHEARGDSLIISRVQALEPFLSGCIPYFKFNCRVVYLNCLR